MQAPPGVKAFVTGPAALAADQHIAGDRSMKMIEAVTFTVIIVMLLLVYRSIITVLLTLVMVVFQLAAARGFVAFLGYHEIIGLSTFATNLLVTLAIAAATDYAIFLIGRYQEARGAGEDRESAYYTMFRGTAHVVLGSGLTIAGATFCLSFTRLPYFQSLGVPLAIGMVVCVFAALSLGPAIITVASKFGKVLEPKRAMRVRGWRKIGAAVVRWPGPILVGTIAISLIGLLTLPGYRTNYNDRNYLPADLPANEGYAAADRHFSAARMNPELLMIESDHDLRNSADFLVIDKIAKAVFRVPGISRVQAITRPDGKPIEHTSIPFQISMQGTTQQMNQKYLQDRMADMLVQADEMNKTIATMDEDVRSHQGDGCDHPLHGDEDQGHDGRHRRIARQHREFRRFLPAAAQLLLLGTEVLQHPDLLGDAVDLRHARRHRHSDRRRSGTAAGPGAPGQTDAAVGHADAADDRDHEDHEEHDADHACHPEGHAGSDRRDAGKLVGDGRSVRPVDERRLVLLCRRKCSTTPSSRRAWRTSSRRTASRCASSSPTTGIR